MSANVLSPGEIRSAYVAMQTHGSQNKAAKALGISRGALQSRLAKPCPAAGTPEPAATLREATRANEELQAKLDGLTKDLEVLTAIQDENITVPAWTLAPKRKKDGPGIPVAIWSDWHWGEIVDPKQVNGVNEYNLSIAHARAKRLVETTIDLLVNHMAHPSYPGIVVMLGGDMLSGDIHDELKQTNELNTYPAALDLLGVLIWCVETLANVFGHVHIPVVFGNHGRQSHKPVAKMAAHQNSDWLIGKLLQLHFKGDKRITFQVSDSADVMFRTYNTTHLLTHGNQFYGGSGIAGMLSPLMLGDARKRSRQNAIHKPYDLMWMGHWHQLFNGRGLVVNGSLKGYDEYAFQGNFGYEIARQALSIFHHVHGMNYWMPVNVQDPISRDKGAAWCAVQG